MNSNESTKLWWLSTRRNWYFYFQTFVALIVLVASGSGTGQALAHHVSLCTAEKVSAPQGQGAGRKRQGGARVCRSNEPSRGTWLQSANCDDRTHDITWYS